MQPRSYILQKQRKRCLPDLLARPQNKQKISFYNREYRTTATRREPPADRLAESIVSRFAYAEIN